MASPRHLQIASDLNIAIGIALKEKKCKCRIYHPIDVKIKNDTVVNPEFLVVCDKIEGHFLERPFPIVIEILSPSTRIKDKVTKYNLYEEFGIQYYVIVDPDDNSVNIFKLDDKGKYQEYQQHTFDLDENCRIEIDFQKAILF